MWNRIESNFVYRKLSLPCFRVWWVWWEGMGECIDYSASVNSWFHFIPLILQAGLWGFLQVVFFFYLLVLILTEQKVSSLLYLVTEQVFINFIYYCKIHILIWKQVIYNVSTNSVIEHSTLYQIFWFGNSIMWLLKVRNLHKCPFLWLFKILYNLCHQFHCRTLRCQLNSEVGSWCLVTTCPENTADMHMLSESAFVPALTMKTAIRVVVKGR